MDVSCSRCGAEYEFEETLVSDRGTTVKCTNCGHLFKVFRPGHSLETVDESKPWLVRRKNGTVEPLVSLGDLTRLIAQGVYHKEDEISRSGQVWKRLGDIAELKGFFSSSRRQQNQKSGTLVVGTTPVPEKQTETELPEGVAPRPQPQSEGTSPDAFPSSESATKNAAERSRRNTPSLWGTTPEAPYVRDQTETIARHMAMKDAALPPLPADTNDARSREAMRQATRDEEKGVATAAAEGDSEQHVPTFKVVPVGSPADEAPISRDSDGYESPRIQARPVRTPAEKKPAAVAVERVPMADEEEEPPRIARSRGGWRLWPTFLLLAAGIAALYWSRSPVDERPAESPVVDRAEEFIERGRKALDAYRVDHFSESVTEFTKAMAFREHDPRLLALLSRTYAVWAQALKFRIMDGGASGNPEEETRLAALGYEVENYAARAMQYAERAERYGPDFAEAMIALSDASRLNGKRDDARVHLEKARMLAPSLSAELLRVEAMISIDAADGDLKAGLESARQAVEKAPESIRLRVLLARCLMAAGERDTALAQLDEVLSRDPEHPEAAALMRAVEDASGLKQANDAGQEAGQRDEAAGRDEEELTRKTEGGISSSNPTQLVQRGEYLLESGAIVRAERTFMRALQMDPNDSRALIGMGYVEIEKGRAYRAVTYFKPAAANGYDEAYIGLGDAYHRLGRKMDALRAYETYVRNRPKGRLVSIARAQIEKYRIEMRKMAEQHKSKKPIPDHSRPTGPQP